MPVHLVEEREVQRLLRTCSSKQQVSTICLVDLLAGTPLLICLKYPFGSEVRCVVMLPVGKLPCIQGYRLPLIVPLPR